MKKLIVASLLTASLSVNAAGFGDYSSGYRVGLITKFSEKGLFTKSGEGQMLMGADSTPYVITTKDSDGNVSRKTINPWYFSSTDAATNSQLENLVGSYAVLGYEEALVKGFTTDTPYSITSIEEVSPPVSEACIAEDYIEGSKSGGTRVGRIVKMSKKGTFVDSNEMMFQQGFSGNQFKNMSITSEQMYDCGLEFLKAGQKVKITYEESFVNLNVLTRSTKYDVIKIEPLSTGLN